MQILQVPLETKPDTFFFFFLSLNTGKNNTSQRGQKSEPWDPKPKDKTVMHTPNNKIYIYSQKEEKGRGRGRWNCNGDRLSIYAYSCNRAVPDSPALAVSWVYFISPHVGFSPCRISYSPFSLMGSQEKVRLLGGFSCAAPIQIKWGPIWLAPWESVLSQVVLLLIILQTMWLDLKPIYCNGWILYTLQDGPLWALLLMPKKKSTHCGMDILN